MRFRTRHTRLPTFVAAALVATACSDAAGPSNQTSNVPRFGTPSLSVTTTSTTGITLVRTANTLGGNGQNLLIKGFNFGNPHHGDAIVATFYWSGSATIDSVADVITTNPYQPVGNKFTLVQQVNAAGWTMATYLATNVQNFADPNIDPGGGDIYAVGAYMSAPVTAGGVTLSAWSGVSAVTAQAIGARRSASGAASGSTLTGPGSIPIGAGAVAYAVTMSGTLAGRDSPFGFTQLYGGADDFLVVDEAYALQSATGSVDPQWFWGFPDSPPSTWLATVIAINPPARLAFSVQPSRTLPLTTIQPAVQVTLRDVAGNPVTSYNGPVTIAIGHNGGLLMPGTLSGTLTVNAVNGVATFSNLSINQPGNGYTLVVDAANVFGAESAPFNIGAL
jgi:hypothetical protein